VKSINRKINGLEDKVLQNPKLGSTKICTCAFPEPEQNLLEKARLFSLRGVPFEEATETEKMILEKAGYILRFCLFDLFTIFLECMCRDDQSARITVHERFVWFIQELRKELDQELEVSEIEKNTPPDCEVDRVDEYYRKAPKLFTEESWYAVQEDLTQRWVKHLKETGKWAELMKKMKVTT
jgi:hypothetical protein